MEWLYIIAASLFIFGLKMLSSPQTARRGNVVSAVGMLLAIVATLSKGGLSFAWIAAGIVIGSAIGAVSAYRVKMTAMPEMVAIFNGFGGVASLLVGWAEYHMHRDAPTFTIVAIYLAVLIGGITFTGSVLAFAKLAELVTGRPVMFRGQHIVNGLLLAAAVLSGITFTLAPEASYAILILGVVLALVIGIFAVLPIGGADMPVVICLLNSYSGLAAAAAGFVLANNMLIVAGSLVGASGIILTRIMCKAMNRSLANVLFSGFGAAAGTIAGAGAKGKAKSISPHDAYFALEAARSVVFVPGYGMAVAQAQHVVKELADLLEANGTEVKYAIHPVAGRMPGHMNVLLAEADVPYDQLVEMDAINPLMPTIDVALVIGANDVVNPAAREDKSSPIYGMPIINVDQAQNVFALKRSMASGFAGVENPLFFKDNTTMIFGDAKKTLQEIVTEFKAA
ncbi:MAG TPA: NAD(P)(+) transhydrogenase (Re/Si-specific) subunit beta [Candidatus Baltobacteraceae bacterium]|nr:NAD(P)(+) transhydrogenase (Re/Si-specific) subunit beta [Candidatus Baltobacteraceae bacterium]